MSDIGETPERRRLTLRLREEEHERAVKMARRWDVPVAAAIRLCINRTWSHLGDEEAS